MLTLIRICSCNPLVKSRYWPVKPLKKRISSRYHLRYQPAVSFLELQKLNPLLSIDDYELLTSQRFFGFYYLKELVGYLTIENLYHPFIQDNHLFYQAIFTQKCLKVNRRILN
jgi:hypothetical protein